METFRAIERTTSRFLCSSHNYPEPMLADLITWCPKDINFKPRRGGCQKCIMLFRLSCFLVSWVGDLNQVFITQSCVRSSHHVKNQPQRCLDPIGFTVDSVPFKPVTKDATGECQKAPKLRHQEIMPFPGDFAAGRNYGPLRCLSWMKILKKHKEAMEPSSKAHSA